MVGVVIQQPAVTVIAKSDGSTVKVSTTPSITATVSQAGASGAAGHDGHDGAQGPQGLQGPVGPQGPVPTNIQGGFF